MIGPPQFRFYDKHCQRALNQPPDWAAVDKSPREHACRKPWLPQDRNASILDFGCGWGHQLAALWAAGYRNLEGVDLVPEQAEIARAGVGGRFPLHCTDGRVFLAERKNRYHLVILNDVLEHFPVSEALPLVTQIYSSLRPGGTAVFRVPNMASLLAGYLLYLDITHHTGFTELSLQQLLDQAGFEDHRFVPDDWGWRPATWRPWIPWRGLGIRGLANQCLHRLLYWLRGQSPKPTRFDWNLEVYSRKPASLP